MVGGQAVEQLGERLGRQDTQQVGRGERRVAEVHQPQVGPLVAQQRREQGEVVVLHEHGGAVGRLLGHRVGERVR